MGFVGKEKLWGLYESLQNPAKINNKINELIFFDIIKRNNTK
jgi:hypothetical protein